MDDFPPNPPVLHGQETGWLEPFLTGVAESCARQGAMAAILACRRMPTRAEAQRGVDACELAFEPDWQAATARAGSFLAVCLTTRDALTDDPGALVAALERAAPTRRGGMAARRQFLEAMPTPQLLALKAVIDALNASEPDWDSV